MPLYLGRTLSGALELGTDQTQWRPEEGFPMTVYLGLGGTGARMTHPFPLAPGQVMELKEEWVPTTCPTCGRAR